MINKEKRMCTRCVMDTSDPNISFNEQGVCNHCIFFDNETSKRWFPNEEGEKRLQIIIDKMKHQGRNNEYDCIIGLSGGVDSSYLALILKAHGVRPLVVHVDAGWNSELAVHNIEKIVKYCNYDLYTHVMDWNEIKDLQLAYMKAGVANQDVVQDHAFFASLYHFATKKNIRYVISGGNIATESVFPKAWHHAAMDAINLKSIHKQFGTMKLRDYKTISFLQYFLFYPFIKKMTVVRPLNYMPYDKNEALTILKNEIGYKEYGRKHGESIFTKFFQNHYLPEKFNIDKRYPHLSSQILSGGITRELALEELLKPLYDPNELIEDKLFIAKKLGISLEQLEFYIKSPGRHYSEFKNWDSYYELVVKLKVTIQRILGKNVKAYS